MINLHQINSSEIEASGIVVIREGEKNKELSSIIKISYEEKDFINRELREVYRVNNIDCITVISACRIIAPMEQKQNHKL